VRFGSENSKIQILSFVADTDVALSWHGRSVRVFLFVFPRAWAKVAHHQGDPTLLSRKSAGMAGSGSVSANTFV
jgi:hypothetical protein